MKLWLIFTISFVLFSLGGLVGYIFWFKAKPKTRTWIAKCYTLSEGVVKRTVLNKGIPTNYKIQLRDLKPYVIDSLKKVSNKTDTIYKLVKQNLTTGAVTADMVDNWGKDNLEVNVLLIGDNATLMKKSYDHELGEIIFRPMERERMEMVKSELVIQTTRYEENKSLLQSVLPWVMTGVIFMALCATAYFVSDALIKVSDKIVTASENVNTKNNQPTNEDGKYGIKPTEPDTPAKAEIG